MARKPNYQYAKRQRDLAKKKKKEAKRLRKLAKKPKDDEDTPDAVEAETPD